MPHIKRPWLREPMSLGFSADGGRPLDGTQVRGPYGLSK